MKLNQSIDKAVTLLETIGRHPQGATVTQLAAEAGIPRPTATRLLATLEARHLVERSERGGSYLLGYELSRLSRAVDVDRALIARMRPALERLAEMTRETVTLAVARPGPRLEAIHQIAAPHRIRAENRLGDAPPLHASADGKVLLAWLGDSELDRLALKPLERLASRTITDPASLCTELARVRAAGWAEIVDELEDGLAAVAMAVHDEGERPPAIVSVTGPSQRFDARARKRAVAGMRKLIPDAPAPT